jgi:hypothetical protein
MKRLGLCFLLLSSVLVVVASAQQQSNLPVMNTDEAAIQNWLARDHTKWRGIDSSRDTLLPDHSDGSMLSLADEPSCVYMRTYRMKRETADSDVTRPAGYTSCVPVARFMVKRAVEPKLEPSE